MSPDRWLPAVGRRLGGTAVVGGRAPLAGGYSSGVVERVDLDVDGQDVPVVVKRASAAEVAAMRAVAVVEGDLAPRMLAAEGDEIVLSFVGGTPLAEGPDVPVEAWTALARVHAHRFRKRPRGIPVVDAAWWRALCDRTLIPLRGALDRTGEPAYATAPTSSTGGGAIRGSARRWAALPKTLCHGDAHRGNVLVDGGTVRLIDWGNARVAPAGLDVATLTAQGEADPSPYHEAFAQLRSRRTCADAPVSGKWCQSTTYRARAAEPHYRPTLRCMASG